MSKITLNSVADLTQSTTAQTTINTNSSTVQTAMDNTLSRDGTSPNQMLSTLDMNSNRIINLPTPASLSEPVTSGYFNSVLAGNPVFSGLISGVPVSAAMTPVVDATTTAAALALLGGQPIGGSGGTAGSITFSPNAPHAPATNVAVQLDLGYLHSKNYATGNGSTDDTAALQNWLTDCCTTGRPGFLDPGTYKITSAIGLIGTSAPLTIVGPGKRAGATIYNASATNNAFYFNCNSRLDIRGFAIGAFPGVTPTAGAAMFIDGPINSSVGGFIKEMYMYPVFNGIVTNGFQTYTIEGCEIAFTGTGVSTFYPGGSCITNNLFDPLNGSTAVSIVVTGNCGGLRICNNESNGAGSAGITATQSVISDGDFFVFGNSFEGCQYGIVFTQAGGFTFGNLMICNNEFGVGTLCISLPNSTPDWILNTIIMGNELSSPAGGMDIESATACIIQGNIIQGGAGPGTGVIKLGTNCKNCVVLGNITPLASGGVTDNSTPGNGNIIVNNPGHNPVGLSTLSPGASPWAYQASSSPETIYMSATGGITNVVRNSTNMFPASLGANILTSVQVDPGDIVNIYYTGTLQGTKMVH